MCVWGYIKGEFACKGKTRGGVYDWSSKEKNALNRIYERSDKIAVTQNVWIYCVGLKIFFGGVVI